MLAREQEFYRRLHQLVDGILLGVSFFLAHLVRSYWKIEVFGGTPEILPFMEHYAWLLLFIIPLGPFVLKVYGFYDRPLLASRRETLWTLSKACFALTLGLILLLWLFRVGPRVGRSVILLFGFISFFTLLLKEEMVRWYRRSAGMQLQRNVILVGSPQETSELRRQIESAKDTNLRIVDEIDINRDSSEQLVQSMHEHAANAVIIAGEHTYFGKIEETIALCEREGVEVWVTVDFFRTRIAQARTDQLYGRPMLVFRSVPDTSWPVVIKRVIDVVGAAVLLVIFAIPMALVAIAVKLSSPGPVLFKQKRAGLNGRPFTLLKFRSMYVDAEERRKELEKFNEIKGPAFKLTNDPRVTPVGRFLRRYSLDELPQLINVLRGEMSLVGPRPLPLDEVARFDNPGYRRRLSMKPGLTCLWQISGRSNVTDFDEWVRLDLEYIDNWSLWLDFKILLRTIPAVLSGEGAK